MKPTSALYFCVLFLTILLTSCSSDSSVESKLIKKAIDVAVDGTSKTNLYSYNGSKIVSISNEESTLDFTYTNDLITKIVESNLVAQTQVTLDYTYSNGVLIKLVSSENYEINFTHLENGNITYEKNTVDGLGNAVLMLHGIMIFENENLINDDAIFDNTPINEVVKEKKECSYDLKPNPLYTILGFKKLLNYGSAISKNNSIYGTIINSVDYLDTNQSISSLQSLNISIEYDGNGYPKERYAVKPILAIGNLISNYKKTLYQY